MNSRTKKKGIARKRDFEPAKVNTYSFFFYVRYSFPLTCITSSLQCYQLGKKKRNEEKQALLEME